MATTKLSKEEEEATIKQFLDEPKVPVKTKPRMDPKDRARLAGSKRRAKASASKGGIPFLAIFAAIVAIGGALGYRALKPRHKPLTEDIISAERVILRDGRHVAVAEVGAPAATATHTVLVLHDIKGCRLSMLPNITKDMLETWGVRLVSYDRPGYGQSDPFPARSVASEADDIRQLADSLPLPEKFHVLAQGLGSYAAWSLLRHAPERVAGAALVSPWASSRMNMTKDEKLELWQSMPRSERIHHLVARLGPWGVNVWYALSKALGRLPSVQLPQWLLTGEDVPGWAKQFVPEWADEVVRTTLAVAGLAQKHGLAPSPTDIGERDLAVKTSEPVAKHLSELEKVAFEQGVMESEYRDLAVFSAKWGFDLSELQETLESKQFKGLIHIWAGAEDRIMPGVVHRYAQRVLPSLTLHEVPQAGHFFLYESSDFPSEILKSLLGLDAAENSS